MAPARCPPAEWPYTIMRWPVRSHRNRQACRICSMISAMVTSGAEIVADHRDRHAVRIEPARHVAEQRRVERAPVAAMDEQRERRRDVRARREQIDELARRSIRSSARARRAAPSWLRRDSPRPRASSVRRSPGARARGRGCCIRLRSRWACDVPLLASLSSLSARGERDGARADERRSRATVVDAFAEPVRTCGNAICLAP